MRTRVQSIEFERSAFDPAKAAALDVAVPCSALRWSSPPHWISKALSEGAFPSLIPRRSVSSPRFDTASSGTFTQPRLEWTARALLGPADRRARWPRNRQLPSERSLWTLSRADLRPILLGPPASHWISTDAERRSVPSLIPRRSVSSPRFDSASSGTIREQPAERAGHVLRRLRRAPNSMVARDGCAFISDEQTVPGDALSPTCGHFS